MVNKVFLYGKMVSFCFFLLKEVKILINSPFLSHLDGSNNNSNESPNLKVQHPARFSHFAKGKETHIESLDNISEKDSAVLQNLSMVSISSQNKTKEQIDTSDDSKELRKKPALHIFTQKTENNLLFFNKMNEKRSR